MTTSPEAAVAVHQLTFPYLREYERFLLGLDPETRRERFNGAVSDDGVRRYARQAIRRGAVLLGAYEDGRICGVAELCPDTAGVAELALAVAPDRQGRGIGTLLMNGAMLAAANRGFRTLRIACLATNGAMTRLAVKARAKLEASANQILGEITLARPSPLSLAREILAESLSRFSHVLQPCR